MDTAHYVVTVKAVAFEWLVTCAGHKWAVYDMDAVLYMDGACSLMATSAKYT
jgi:hypothetical protein